MKLSAYTFQTIGFKALPCQYNDIKTKDILVVKKYVST